MMRRLRVVARVAPQVPALHLQICIIVNLGACCLQRSQQCSAVAERCAAARPVRKAHSGRTRDVASRRRALPARLTWYAIFVSLPNSTELLINCDATIARQCRVRAYTDHRHRLLSHLVYHLFGACRRLRDGAGTLRSRPSSIIRHPRRRRRPMEPARKRTHAIYGRSLGRAVATSGDSLARDGVLGRQTRPAAMPCGRHDAPVDALVPN
jgi:hypothetical protein